MNSFETGRIYSGIVDGERVQFAAAWTRGYHTPTASNGHGATPLEDFSDVRGPLVVLDLDPTDIEIVRDVLIRSIRPSAKKAADQIEEQTRPPRQTGWHEVKGSPMPRRWDGRAWHIPTGEEDLLQDYTSTHYIGPGSGDQS